MDFNELMKKAQQISQNMQGQQTELAKETFSVSVGGEMVKMMVVVLLVAVMEPESVAPGSGSCSCSGLWLLVAPGSGSGRPNLGRSNLCRRSRSIQ